MRRAASSSARSLGRGQCVARRLNFFLADANSVLLELYPIEAPSEAYERTVAAAPHLSNYLRGGFVHIIAIATARLSQKFQEPIECGRAKFKQPHQFFHRLSRYMSRTGEAFPFFSHLAPLHSLLSGTRSRRAPMDRSLVSSPS